MNKAVELKQGQNQLFADPDADKAREFFRHKSRAMVNKVTTAEEAVKTLLKDGDYLDHRRVRGQQDTHGDPARDRAPGEEKPGLRGPYGDP